MKIQSQKLFQNKCYINGNWIDSNNKQTIDVNNPASLEIIGNVPKCGTDETKLAIEAASNALPEWKAKTAKERSIFLKKWFHKPYKSLILFSSFLWRQPPQIRIFSLESSLVRFQKFQRL